MTSRHLALAWLSILATACGGQNDAAGNRNSTGPGSGSGGSGGSGTVGGASNTAGTAAIGGSESAGGGDQQGGASGSATAGGADSQNGGSAGDGNAGSAGNPTSPPFTPPECADQANTTLPESAPVLEPGVWTDITPNQEPFSSGTFSQGLAIDPCNAATIYLTQNFLETKPAGLFRSTDAGTSWIEIGDFHTPLRVRVDPADPLHLYVGDGVRGNTQGFWVSTDGGESFFQPQGWKDKCTTVGIASCCGLDDVYDVAVDPSDFNHVLVSFHAPGSWCDGQGTWSGNAGVLESTDGGESWVGHAPKAGWGYGHSVWFLSSSSTWLLGTQGSGFHRTTDSGVTWTQVTNTDMTHGGGEIYYAKTGVLYAASVNGVIRSTDDGVTWTTAVSLGGGVTGVFGDGSYLYTHLAYYNMSSFFYSPEDDGMTWTEFGGGSQQWSDGPYEMAFDEANGILYSGNWWDGILALKVVP
jgi:hypothetical protein